MAKIDKKKRMIEVAEFLFANPDKERADVLAKFGKKWQMGVRTLDRVIQEAKEYNLQRIRELEEKKAEVYTEEALKSAKGEILSRNEALKILSDIAKGTTTEENQPNASDKIRAVQQMAKMQGWEAPTKSELEVKDKIVIGYKKDED